MKLGSQFRHACFRASDLSLPRSAPSTSAQAQETGELRIATSYKLMTLDRALMPNLNENTSCSPTSTSGWSIRTRISS